MSFSRQKNKQICRTNESYTYWVNSLEITDSNSSTHISKRKASYRAWSSNMGIEPVDESTDDQKVFDQNFSMTTRDITSRAIVMSVYEDDELPQSRTTIKRVFTDKNCPDELDGLF